MPESAFFWSIATASPPPPPQVLVRSEQQISNVEMNYSFVPVYNLPMHISSVSCVCVCFCVHLCLYMCPTVQCILCSEYVYTAHCMKQ